MAPDQPIDTSGKPDGPPLAFAAVYRAWFRPVCRWLRALGGPGVDAEDLAQEVFLVVQRRLPDFTGDDPRAWIYGISFQVSRAARRRAWFRRAFFSDSGEGAALDEVPHKGPGPDELVEQRQREQVLYRLLAKMSEKHRTVFVLFEIAGYRAEEIAPLLDLPAATVRTRLFHARKKFVALAARQRRRDGT